MARVAKAMMFVSLSMTIIVLLQCTIVVAWSTSLLSLYKATLREESSQIQYFRRVGDSFENDGQKYIQQRVFRPLPLLSSSTESEEDTAATNPGPILRVHSHSGLTDEELSVLVGTVEEVYAQTVGLSGVSCATEASNGESTQREELLVGTLHRVLSLEANLDEESAEILRASIAERMDHLIYGSGELKQPVLVSVEKASSEDVLRQEIEQYGLRVPVHFGTKISNENDCMYTPAFSIEIDGAETLVDQDSGETFWDTSSVVVFDNLVSDDLRKRLLHVVKGKSSDEWNDVEHGPDPNRWVRGGLSDIPDGKEDQDVLSCWGLPVEAIEEICFEKHEAIQEFESILTKLFPQFVVSRLPEAVYGECVSPLTANAPVAGEEELYDYHIDGDPLQTPPSPWTDVYGRYPNRSPGKPRFMSCILYLNDEWDGEKWGAPTKFYDPPTSESCEVLPQPGRCVFLDQDLGHTVTPPKAAAGKRPRYSLVWKLILHPKNENQDMTDLSNSSSSWPKPELFGSALKVPSSP